MIWYKIVNERDRDLTCCIEIMKNYKMSLTGFNEITPINFATLKFNKR